MGTIGFMGVGFQELLLQIIFLFLFIGVPLITVIIVKTSRRKRFIKQEIAWKNADKLIDLKLLREKGTISADEFESEKKKILES
jgi:uncharacterized membrane protein